MLVSLPDSSRRRLLARAWSRSSEPFPLVRAVLDGTQPGSVLVDRPEEPQLAFVASRFGFAQLLADIDDDGADAVVRELFGNPLLVERYLLWYDPPEACQRLLDALAGEVARRRTRIRLSLDRERFERARSAMPPSPSGVEVVEVDAPVLARLEPLGLEIGSRFWPSDDAFLAHGVGVAAFVDDAPASVCYSACTSGGIAEVDVATAEPFRGRGLAAVVTAQFVLRCIERDLAPSWDCFDYNEPSLRLAKSVGFEEQCRYPFYSVNT